MTGSGGDTSGQVATLRAEMDAQKVNVARFWAQEWPALLRRLDESHAHAVKSSESLARIDEKLTAMSALITAIVATQAQHNARLTALENVRWYAAGIALALSAALTWIAAKVENVKALFDHTAKGG